MTDHDLSHSCCTSSKEVDLNIYHFQPRWIHYQTPITPSWCNVTSTFSSLSSTPIPPHKRDQIYSRHCCGICSMEDIQGLFTCWLAMERLEKRLSFVKWSTGKQPLGYLVKVWSLLRMLSVFPCCQELLSGFLLSCLKTASHSLACRLVPTAAASVVLLILWIQPHTSQNEAQGSTYSIWTQCLQHVVEMKSRSAAENTAGH